MSHTDSVLFDVLLFSLRTCLTAIRIADAVHNFGVKVSSVGQRVLEMNVQSKVQFSP